MKSIKVMLGSALIAIGVLIAIPIAMGVTDYAAQHVSDAYVVSDVTKNGVEVVTYHFHHFTHSPQGIAAVAVGAGIGWLIAATLITMLGVVCIAKRNVRWE